MLFKYLILGLIARRGGFFVKGMLSACHFHVPNIIYDFSLQLSAVNSISL